MCSRPCGVAEPNAADIPSVGQVAEDAPDQLRRDVMRDRHEGAHVVGADFAAVEGDAESGSCAFADQVGATNAEQVQGCVAAEFAFGPAR